MTGKFELGILGAAACLVVSSLTVAVIHPPSSDFTVPRAQIDASNILVDDREMPDRREGIFSVRALSEYPESLTKDVDIEENHYGYGQAEVHTVEDLTKVFDQIGYNLDGVSKEGVAVPRLFLAHFPLDMAEIREIKKRKALFFKSVLPLILQTNDEIWKDRHRLVALNSRAKKSEPISAADRLWLIVLAERYNVDETDLTELLKRVDGVPVSLALAQAAEESGWGTSRFSLEGNAIFGEWTFSNHQGLVPRDRESGKSHKVRTFNTLLDSVRAYVHNLNTHRAYQKFRILRSEMRESGSPVHGRKLSKTLTSYSERGSEYIEGLRVIISVNKLDRLDNAKLIRREAPGQPGI